jgi:hypothetical protein
VNTTHPIVDVIDVECVARTVDNEATGVGNFDARRTKRRGITMKVNERYG